MKHKARSPIPAVNAVGSVDTSRQVIKRFHINYKRTKKIQNIDSLPCESYSDCLESHIFRDKIRFEEWFEWQKLKRRL